MTNFTSIFNEAYRKAGQIARQNGMNLHPANLKFAQLVYGTLAVSTNPKLVGVEFGYGRLAVEADYEMNYDGVENETFHLSGNFRNDDLFFSMYCSCLLYTSPSPRDPE